MTTGAQPGLVSTDACHVTGEQRCRRRTERDQEPAGEAGVHHEAGGQPVRAADGAQGAGASCDPCTLYLINLHYHTHTKFEVNHDLCEYSILIGSTLVASAAANNYFA